MTQEEDDYDSSTGHGDHLPSAFASLSIKKSTSQHKHHSIQRRRKPQADMPKLANLDQLNLHSPSSQIVGTPYATDSKKFEYPFPEEDASSYSVSACSSSHATPAILTPPLSSGSTYPILSASASPAHLTLPCLIQPGDSSSSSSTTSSTSSFTPVHPKLKLPSNPPIPPSLVKKRPKWSLSIMGRRRSSYENGAFSDEDDGSMSLVDSFFRSDRADGVIVLHSQRDEPSRNEH